MSDFKKLKVVELRAECASRSLIQTGKRDELIERLEEYEFHNAEPVLVDDMNVDEVETDIKTEVNETPIPVSPKSQVLVSELFVQPTISSVQASTPVDLAVEEEKLRLRALRFGINSAEKAPVKIEVTIKKLEHALPNRTHHNNYGYSHRNRNRKNHYRHNNNSPRQVSIHKA